MGNFYGFILCSTPTHILRVVCIEDQWTIQDFSQSGMVEIVLTQEQMNILEGLASNVAKPAEWK